MITILMLMLKGFIFWGILFLLVLVFITIRIALKGIRLYEFYYPSGKVSSRAYLNRHKEFEGLEKKFYENGNLESIIPYKNGIINGLVTYFYDNRRLKSKILFKNGIEEEILESYDKNGNKIK